MLNLFGFRRDRPALEQLLSSISSGAKSDVQGCAAAASVTHAWTSLDARSRSEQQRTHQLEKDCCTDKTDVLLGILRGMALSACSGLAKTASPR